MNALSQTIADAIAAALEPMSLSPAEQLRVINEAHLESSKTVLRQTMDTGTDEEKAEIVRHIMSLQTPKESDHDSQSA